jgi:eukaryotic-like serine/threonine-protein kinase
MPDSPSLVGQIISHYRIIEKLGAGGMGEVYRARDERLKRDVAFKILQPDSQGTSEAERKLLSEARSASALNDSHICVIYEVGEAGGHHFIVMELVEGTPLNSLIVPEGLRPELVVRYGAQIATALAHAHDRGIIHRDIKTANIVITPSGQVKVLDFGLAKLHARREFAEATSSTQSAINTGAIVGTLPYIAPEILRSEEACERSDIWSLGITLYEMSAGNRPFRGQTAFELTSEILRDPLPPLPHQLPAGLRRVIERCLRKKSATATSGQVKSALPSKLFKRSLEHLPPPFLLPPPRRVSPSAAGGFAAASPWRSLPLLYSLPTSVVCVTGYSITPRRPVFIPSPFSPSRIFLATLNSNTSPME